MLVLDAATLYPRLTRGGDLYSVDVIDGSTITPLIAEDGRTPEPPDPAYQQVLHGVPAADFTSEELLYLPRNPRPHRLYGMSPVEQVALTINIALRRDMATLDYYKLGSTPDAFATLPKDWTLDQIRQFQDYFDALMSGNSARRRMVKFMPTGFELRETRQPPLKDQYDEWLARVICYAFSIPPSPFVNQTNRATSETLRVQAAQEGLVPLKAWVKGVLDEIVQVCLKQPDLEFAWVGDDAVDPLQQAQTLSLLVGAGIKTREEARAELGLAPEPAVGPGPGKPIGRSGKPVAKYNPYHDERGRFTTPDGAVEPSGGEAPAAPKPEGVEVASNDATRSDATAADAPRQTTPAAASGGDSNGSVSEFARLPGEPDQDYWNRLLGLITERPDSREDVARLVARLTDIRDSLLSDPELNAWRQGLSPDAYRNPAVAGGVNPYDPFKDYAIVPGGGSRQDAWIPFAAAPYDRMAADGLVYTFPPSAFVASSPLNLLGAIDNRYAHLTGKPPNWTTPAPVMFGGGLPAPEPNPLPPIAGASPLVIAPSSRSIPWEPPATAPVGRLNAPIEIQPGTNPPATIDNVPFSGHALDRTEGRGIPPSVIIDMINTGLASPTRSPEVTAYYNSANNMTVYVNNQTGRVITIRYGKP
jgi:hypothetical protein